MDSTTKPSTLIEHVADWHTDLMVDRTNRTVRNVALTGVTSKNGYRYTEQALRAAAVLYEDKPVFLDHANDKSRPHERSTRDLVGTIVNPRYESGRIRGDIRVLDTDSGRTFLALSELDAPGVGMSHVVLAQRTAGSGAVDRIHDVVSVDAVVFPATTKTFRESLEGPSDEAAPDTIDSGSSNGNESPSRREHGAAAADGRVRESHDAPADSLSQPTPELPDSPPPDRLQQLLWERDQLLAQLRGIRDREEAEARDRRIEQQLREARLPAYAVTVEFRRQLLDTDESTRTALITERRRLIEAAGRQPPRSLERSVARQTADVNRAFVAAIRRTAS